jgi:adenine phosphoribosyltransferase
MPEVDLRQYVHAIPDWPTAGVTFLDITPMLADATAFRAVTAALAEVDEPVDAVVGIEARGFILGAAVARHLDVGFVPVRKHGKLPRQTHSAAYALEYGDAVLEIHTDAFPAATHAARPANVLVVDDVLATGGTLAAALGLVEQAGATIAGVTVLIEIPALGGAERLQGRPYRAVLGY